MSSATKHRDDEGTGRAHYQVVQRNISHFPFDQKVVFMAI